MSMAMKSATVAGLIGAFALGVWAGPMLTDRTDAASRVVVDQPATPAREAPARPAAVRRTARAMPVSTVAPSAPELQAELKPLLRSGSNMELAAQGFKDAEQFAMVAHAARNTQVPFVLLKDRLLNERKSLAAAIKEFKPNLDAEAEATRARAAARSDLARLGG